MGHPCGLFHTTTVASANVSLRFAALIGCRSIQLCPEAFWSVAFDKLSLEIENELRDSRLMCICKLVWRGQAKRLQLVHIKFNVRLNC